MHHKGSRFWDFNVLSILEMLSLGQGTNSVKASLILHTCFFKLFRFQDCQFGTKNKFTLENEIKKWSHTVFYFSIFIFIRHSDKG